MKSKSFLFINSWMQPLKALSFEQRWNVLEAVVEYACSETLSESLDAIEGIAFGFIRNEIDRMKSKHAEVSAKKRAAANSRWERKQTESLPGDSSPCNDMHADAPYDIESESKSGSESKPESSDKPTATTDARVRGNAGKASSSYDDSQLLGRFFDCQNQAKLDALGMKHHVGISDLRSLAEEITMQWALTEKTHDSYHDAASHLVYALGDRIARECRTTCGGNSRMVRIPRHLARHPPQVEGVGKPRAYAS